MSYKMKEVTIRPKLNGWEVKVGCAEVVFTNRKKMFAEISKYINDPDKVEKFYRSQAKNEQDNIINSGVISSGSTVFSINK